MTGRVPRRVLLDNPDVLAEGSEWIVYSRETGQVLGFGYLKNPADNGGVVDLSADGPAILAERELDRLLYMKRGSYRAWVEEDSEEHGRGVHPLSAPTLTPGAAGNVNVGMHHYRVTFVTADGETRPGPRSDLDILTSAKHVLLSNIPKGPRFVTARNIYRTSAGGSTYGLVTTISDNTTTTYDDNLADSGLGASPPDSFEGSEIDAQAGEGALVFEVPKGASVFDGQFAAMIFSADSEELNKVNLAFVKSRDATAYRVRLSSADDDESAFVSEQSWVMDEDAPGEETIRLDNQGATSIRIAFERIGDTTDAEHFKLKVINLEIFGRAIDEDFSTSDVVRDIGAELGLGTSRVRESGVPALPADFQNGTYGQVLDLMALLSGAKNPWRWLIYRVGRSLELDFAPFSRQRYVFDSSWGLSELLPLPVYSHSLITFDRADGTPAQIIGKADPNPLGFKRVAPPVHIDHPGGHEKGQRFADGVADFLATQRYAGTLEFARLRTLTGAAVDHSRIHAGVEIFVPNLKTFVQVDELEGDDTTTVSRHPERLPILDRWEAKREKRRSSKD